MIGDSNDIMISAYDFRFKDQQLKLLPQRALFWKDQKMLILGDLHLGKINHFRKSGIAIPEVGNQKNWSQLNTLIDHYPTNKVLFLGDLFHSDYNQEWLAFKSLLQDHSSIEFILVKGNHDILDEHRYNFPNLTVVEDHLEISPFVFSHDEIDSKLYSITAHVHPAIRLRSKSKRVGSMKLPCFYFGKNAGIVPAFGVFTGTHTITPKKGDFVFGIAGSKVVHFPCD